MLKEIERYKKMFENSQDWFWEFDENAYFTYVSPSIKDLLGYEPEEVIGLNAFELMNPGETERVRKHFDPIAKKYLPFKNLENENVHKDGHTVVIESSGTPIFSETGQFCGYRGIDRDITERKKLIKEVKRTAQLAALGTVAAEIAHEINNPIQGILNYATLINQAPEKIERVRDISERIIQEIVRIACITKDLLYYSKDNVVDMIISDVHESIESALTLMETKVKRQGIAIERKVCQRPAQYSHSTTSNTASYY